MEATELLREISMYPGLSEKQLYRFHPGKESKVSSLLTILTRQGRITKCGLSGYVPIGSATARTDPNMMKAVWVLLDFLDRAEYHSVSAFPVNIVFFADGSEYEIIYVPCGQEVLISQALRMHSQSVARRIVVVDSPQQISALSFPGICGYCTVSADGQVDYYKKRSEE